MLELDEVVRQNQLACLPFAKSGRAEAELFEAHPELNNIIERGRRAKIDSFRLQSRLRDEELYYMNAAKAKALPQDDDGASTSSQKSRRKSFHERDATSTPLRQKTSNVDLMFEMEEDPNEAMLQGSSLSTPLLDRNRLHSSTRLNDLSSSLPYYGPAPNERNEASALGSNLGLSASPSLGFPSQPPEFANSPEDARTIPGPWASSMLDSSKLNMKEIMAQASSNRKSSLSSGLALKGRTAESTASGAMAKLSQRERKRQQQQGQIKQPDTPISSTPSEQPEETGKLASPWQVASAGPRVSLQDVLGTDSSKSPSPSTEKSRRHAPTPPLTLRQTVSGNVPAVRRAASGGPPQQHSSTLTRSISTPAASNKPSSSPSTGTGNQSPSIRSVRHAPPPVEPSLQLSMADILSQQQTEKDVIKEAVAKRSLQEIQEEQAFQEWWDQESKKLQEEEEEAARGKTVSPRGGKTGAGRGRSKSARGRGRGRGRGESSDAARSKSKPSGEVTSTERDKGTRSRGDAGYGRGRGTRIPTT